MPREAKLFDGTTLQFPDNTSDDVIMRVAKQQTMAKQGQGGQQAPQQQPQAPQPALQSPPAPATSQKPQNGRFNPRLSQFDKPPPDHERQPLPFARQVQYDMATNDIERARVLRSHYGSDHVGKDDKGIYVRMPNGKKLYPTSTLGTSITAQAAPTLGSIAGGAVGGAIGAPGGPGFAIGGAMSGAAVGAAAGQGVNDVIMKMMNFYDRTGAQEAENLGVNAALGAAGEGVGRAVAAVPGGIKTIAQKAVSKFADVDPEKMAEAKALAEQGYRVAPTGYARGLRYPQRQVELAKRVTGADPIGDSTKKFVGDRSVSALTRSGMSPDQAKIEGERLKTIARPSMDEAGEKLKGAAADEVAGREAQLDAKAAQIRAEAQAKGETETSQVKAATARLQSRHAELDGKLQKDVNAGIREIDALRAKAKPGNIAKDLAEKITAFRTSISAKASSLYRAADDLGGSTPISTVRLDDAAGDFVKALPEELRAMLPQRIRDIEKGDIATMTFSELHQLRSILRDMAYSEKLTPDMKRGPYKYFAGIVNDTLQREAKEAGLKDAVVALGRADKFYARNMAQFRNQTLQHIVDQTKDRLYPNPEVVSRLVIQQGEASTLKRVMQIGGEEISNRIRNTDLGEMLDAALDKGSGKIDPKKFLEEVATRYKNGTLDVLYGDKAHTIHTLARRLAARSGSLGDAAFWKGEATAQRQAAKTGMVPGTAAPFAGRREAGGMTVDNFVRRLQLANRVSDKIVEISKRDPVKIMGESMTGAEKQIADLRKEFEREFGAGSDALSFLRNPHVLYEEAAQRVADNDQLLEMAIKRFGNDSPAITTLRQKALERLIAPVIRGEGAQSMTSGLARMSEKTQDMLFPNGQAKELQDIVKGIQLMAGEGTGSMPGLAAGGILKHSLLERWKPQMILELEANLYTHPAYVKLISSLAGDFRAGGNRALNGMAKARGLLAKFEGAGMNAQGIAAAQMVNQNQGRPEDQREAPQQDSQGSSDDPDLWKRYAQ